MLKILLCIIDTRTRTISLMKTTKCIGPKTDSWGTPEEAISIFKSVDVLLCCLQDIWLQENAWDKSVNVADSRLKTRSSSKLIWHRCTSHPPSPWLIHISPSGQRKSRNNASHLTPAYMLPISLIAFLRVRGTDNRLLPNGAVLERSGALLGVIGHLGERKRNRVGKRDSIRLLTANAKFRHIIVTQNVRKVNW